MSSRFLSAPSGKADSTSLQGPLAHVRGLKPFELENVVLEFDASDRLIWFDLLTAIEGLLDFISTFGGFERSFVIRKQGSRQIGSGKLMLKRG